MSSCGLLLMRIVIDRCMLGGETSMAAVGLHRQLRYDVYAIMMELNDSHWNCKAEWFANWHVKCRVVSS